MPGGVGPSKSPRRSPPTRQEPAEGRHLSGPLPSSAQGPALLAGVGHSSGWRGQDRLLPLWSPQEVGSPLLPRVAATETPAALPSAWPLPSPPLLQGKR